MDGEQFELIMRTIGCLAIIYLPMGQSLAAEAPLDASFLEWLGQVAEVEELGVDINELLEQQEQQDQNDETKDNLK